MTNAKTNGMTDGVDVGKGEQGEMRTVLDEFDKSANDETRQVNAYKALTELKRIRNKQRKF